jgi:hypothetical protein
MELLPRYGAGLAYRRCAMRCRGVAGVLEECPQTGALILNRGKPCDPHAGPLNENPGCGRWRPKGRLGVFLERVLILHADILTAR